MNANKRGVPQFENAIVVSKIVASGYLLAVGGPLTASWVSGIVCVWIGRQKRAEMSTLDGRSSLDGRINSTTTMTRQRYLPCASDWNGAVAADDRRDVLHCRRCHRAAPFCSNARRSGRRDGHRRQSHRCPSGPDSGRPACLRFLNRYA